ncbi:hypothetical protein BGZ73_000149 [Actinomortierella ambigua]|nr:hypothetical protein BGZ73_000149 [Actinomortierella ambigua]
MVQQKRSFVHLTQKISIAVVVIILAILVASLYTVRNEALDNLLTQHRLVADPYSIIRAPKPREEIPINRIYPVPKSRWDPSKRYLTYLPFGGISNQFYSFQNAATIALRLNRTLVVPPIISNKRHDEHSTHQPWSHFMDLDYVREQVGLDVVEWHQIKHLDYQSLELIQQGSRLTIPPGWRAMSERFPCQVVRGYGQEYWINAGDDSIGADFAYQYLLALEAIPVPGTDRYSVTGFVDDIVQGNQPSNETVICLSFTFTAQFERGHNRWDIGWNTVGRHVRFLPRFAAYVEDLIAFRFAEWERYQPLTEDQVSGMDELPSETLRHFFEESAGNPREENVAKDIGGGSVHVKQQKTKKKNNKIISSVQGSVAKGPIIRPGLPKDREVGLPSSRAQKTTASSAPIISAQSQEPARERAAPREYIAIHLRRGDIDSKCAGKGIQDCTIPLSEYKKHVDKIIRDHAAAAADNNNSTSAPPEPAPSVVLLSDTKDEAEKQEIDEYGWYRLDYGADENLIEAWQVLGPFAPAFIDSAVLAGRSARWVIGSRRSTMSWLAAMRLASWFNRTIAYPALPPHADGGGETKGDGGGVHSRMTAEAQVWKRGTRDFWMDEEEKADNAADELVVLDRREVEYFDGLFLQ